MKTILFFIIFHQIAKTTPQLLINENVSNCFAKIKTMATLDTAFRNALDSVARTSRIDSIIRLLMAKVDENCLQNEKDLVINYFDQHKKAIELTENVLKNLTNEEKDHLNIWNNLNDTASEARLFLKKFQSLSNKNQAVLRKSLNDVLNTFVASSLSPNLSKAIAVLNKSDVEQLQLYAKEHQYSSLSYLIASKINESDISPSEMNNAYTFLYNTFGGKQN